MGLDTNTRHKRQLETIHVWYIGYRFWPPDSLCADLVLFVELVPGGEQASDVLGHFHILLQMKAQQGKPLIRCPVTATAIANNVSLPAANHTFKYIHECV